MKKHRKQPLLAAFLTIGAVLAVAIGLTAGTAAAVPNTIGSVTCDLPVYNSTHFALEVGQTVTCTIDATGNLVGSPTTVPVRIKSSLLGNETVIGTVSGNIITFTYTGRANGCDTTNIDYDKGNGQFENAHAGFGFVDSEGEHLVCSEKASPGITTIASGAGKTGDALVDTAYLTGGFMPPSGSGGTVTFSLYGPGDTTCSTAIFTNTVDVVWDADGTAEPSSDDDAVGTTGSNIAATAGTYRWVASYSGNDQNEAVGPTACNDPAEASAITAAAPTLTTEIHLDPGHGAVTAAVALGSSVHDSAAASVSPEADLALGKPTGDVDFTFYKGECGDETNFLFSDLDNTLVDGAFDPSESSGALGAGSYHFFAHYDSDNEAVWSDSDSLCEPLTVNKAQLTIVTQIHNALHGDVGGAVSVPLGSVVHDTATVTGAVPGFPIGAISFTLNAAAVANDPAADGTATARSVDSAPLGAGSYTYAASVAAGGDNYFGDTSDDEPLTVDKAQLTIVTQIHNALHGDVGGAVSVPLGSVVHDTATVTGAVPGFPIGAISFTLNAAAVANDPAADGTATARSVDSAPLGAGSYTYAASVAAGGDNYFGDTSDDEPLTVDKAQLTIVTAIHNAAHADITGTTVPVGTVVHDTATVTGGVSGFPIGAISFTLNGNAVTNANPAEAGYSASTVDSAPLAGGSYIYKANVAGGGNYFGDDSPDEPLSVRTLGLTMGFWGNTNGQRRICGGTISAATCLAGYLANVVDIGRGGVIDTQAESLKVLPNTKNACGKGNPLIFTGAGAATATANCGLAAGINSDINTLAAQTLALGYNIKLVANYTGQSISGLGCSAYVPTAGLTGASTVNDALVAARGLIENSRPGGTTTQAMVGAMNALLGCLNREA